MTNWSNTFYNIMKYILTIGVPAFIGFYSGLCALYGWTNAEIVNGTVALVAAFIGALLNISSNKYHKKEGE